jgi:cell division septation protein DedD
VIKAPRNQLEHIGNYYIQIGSFVGEPEVVLMARIKAQNLHYKIIHFPQNGKEVSKLLIGPYKDRNQALMMLKQIRTTIEPTAFIAEIR